MKLCWSWCSTTARCNGVCWYATKLIDIFAVAEQMAYSSYDHIQGPSLFKWFSQNDSCLSMTVTWKIICYTYTPNWTAPLLIFLSIVLLFRRVWFSFGKPPYSIKVRQLPLKLFVGHVDLSSTGCASLCTILIKSSLTYQGIYHYLTRNVARWLDFE